MKQKKQNEIGVLLGYAGKYKALTFLGMFLSAVAMIMGMAPYVCIWLAARDLIRVAPNWTEATEIAKYGWAAFAFAFGGIIVYFSAEGTSLDCLVGAPFDKNEIASRLSGTETGIYGVTGNDLARALAEQM